MGTDVAKDHRVRGLNPNCNRRPFRSWYCSVLPPSDKLYMVISSYEQRVVEDWIQNDITTPIIEDAYMV